MIYGDWLARRAALSPHAIALLDASQDFAPSTYLELAARTHQAAHWLKSLGIGVGDRVAVLAQNSVEWLELWLACGRIGAVLQALNWRLTALELEALVREASPRLLLYGTELGPLVESLRGRLMTTGAARVSPAESRGASNWSEALPSKAGAEPAEQNVVFARLHGDLALAAEDLTFESRLNLSTQSPEPVDLTAESPWVLCYTGGTTGLPKAAILTHGAMTWNAINTVMSWGLTPGDVTFLNAPLFHTGGMNVLTLPLIHIGGTTIVCRNFDPEQVFEMLEHRGITLFFGVPTMFIALQQHPRWSTARLECLKWVISGGAPCPEPIFRTFLSRGVAFKTGYGLTEAGPNNFWLPNAEVAQKLGRVGRPLFHVDVRVVRSDGSDCAVGEAGELWIRGPHVCAGYFNRPEENRKTFQDGWLKTGDLAEQDEDGCYAIVGRLKDVIISGGENIYPAEVENVFAGHPAVSEVAIIGVPDERWGEVGLAIVVLKAGQEASVDALLSFAQQSLARYKLPKRVVFAEALPRTGAGKVDKRILKQLWVENSAS